MYFHLVCSPEFFAVTFSKKSARKDQEFAQNPTSPPYVFHPYPFHAGISSCLGKRAMAVF